jgi:hypothetical protein
MNKKFLIAWLAIIAVAVLASGATHWVLCGRQAVAQEQLSDMQFLTRQLGLDPVQAEALGKLQAAVAVQLADCCARHCAARAQLGQALAGGAGSEALIQAMGQAYEESERATWAHIQQVRAQLTPAQQARYDELIGRCVSGACNMSNVSK